VTDGRAEPDLDAWLRHNREAVLRRWIEVVVERSSLADLAEHPLSDWMRALEARLAPPARRE